MRCRLGLMIVMLAGASYAGEPVRDVATASAPAGAATVDRADPRSAARAWLHAMKAMDADELGRHIAPLEDKELSEHVSATLRLAAGKAAMRKVAAKLFPDDPQLPKPRLYENMDLFIAALEKATPVIEGGQATYALTQPIEGGAEMKVVLRKVGDAWWVDGPGTVGVAPVPAAERQKLVSEIARQRTRAACYEEIARRAEAGEFGSYPAMEKAFFTARRKAEEKHLELSK